MAVCRCGQPFVLMQAEYGESVAARAKEEMRQVVRLAGIEPATLGFGVTRSSDRACYPNFSLYLLS